MLASKRFRAEWLIAALACCWLAGCSGGSEPATAPGGSGAANNTAVSGTAAFGAPIANAPVTLKDAAGKLMSGRTAADGSYSLNTTGMTPPFLIQVQTPSGNLYSVSADGLATTTINVNVYSDLIARSWYTAQGQSIDTAFANPVALPGPDASVVGMISGVASRPILGWMSRAGLDASSFNVISTPFMANGTGFDAVLHESSMNLGTGTLTISDGSTTQTSTITYDTSANSLAISWAATGPRGSSVDFTTTVIPVSPAAEAALNSIAAAMTTLASTLNSRGSQLADTDILPLLAGDALNDGWDRNTYAGMLASSFRGLGGGFTSTYDFRLRTAKTLDLASGQATVSFDQTVTTTGPANAPVPPLPPATSSGDLYFERVGGAWLLRGDGRLCNIGFGRSISIPPSTSPSYSFMATATCPKGNAKGAQVTGGGFWNATVMPKVSGSSTLFYSPEPGVNAQADMEQFRSTAVTPATPVAAGTAFTVRITPASGNAIDYNIFNPAETTETISILSPTTTSLAGITLDQPFQVTWTRPTTFAVRTALLIASVLTGPPGSAPPCRIATVAVGDSTSSTVNVPSTCAGSAVTSATIIVFMEGFDGESVQATLTLN